MTPQSAQTPPVPAFVASTGGHLVQLYRMASLLEPDRFRDAVWITHRSPQSESMLRDRNVVFVPLVHSRDWRAVIKRTPTVLRILKDHNVDAVYSTGAAIALSALPWARFVGAKPRYIESLARSQAPSLSGKVLERLPWVTVYTQYPQNASRRWRHEYSLLDSFRVETAAPARDPQRIFVTLGTTPWQFRRLVERVLEIAPRDAEIVWQTGVTDLTGLDIKAQPMMPDEAFREEIRKADVVVSHSGVGTFLNCLEAGKVPVLVPRRSAYTEHIDDHQEQIASVADARGLAVMREVDNLTLEDLRETSRLRAIHVLASEDGSAASAS